MKKLILLILFLAVAVGAYYAGYVRARQEMQGVALADALQSASFSASALDALTQNRAESTRQLLDAQMRAAVAKAEELKRKGAELDVSAASLMDGLRRAKQYAERAGDSALAQRAKVLYEELSEEQVTVTTETSTAGASTP